MNMPVDLSCAVVIVCHDYGRFLGEAIESVLAQSLPATEIVIILDHCSDESHQVAKQYPVEVVITNACDPHLARRLGFRATQSEIVIFLDADDWLSSNYIEAGAPVFKNEKVGIVTGDIQRFGFDNYYIPARPGEIEIENRVTSAALVRRTAIEQSRCFEDFSLVQIAAEDWECWKRIAQAGWTIANPPQPITHHHRRHGNNRTLSRLYEHDHFSRQERRAIGLSDDRIKIGYVTPSVGMGGAETQVVSQIRHARKLDWISAWVPEEAPSNVEIRSQLPPLYRGRDGLAELCRKSDLIYVWGLPEEIERIRDLTSAPIVYGVHGEGDWTRNAVEYVCDDVDILMCVSRGAVNTIPTRWRGKARLIRGGADLSTAISHTDRSEIRQAWGIGTNELAVGYVGRLSLEKNPVVIARAVAQMPNTKLVVCSPQAFDQENPLRREMAELLRKRVVWTNSAAQPMGNVYRGLDCVVVASHEEGMPTVTLEAWLAGLSVVSTPVGLIRELEPRYGPLIERVPLNPAPEAIATAIAKALVPNPLRSEVARELVINELSMQRMTVEFEEMVAQQFFNPSATRTVAPKAAPRARGYLTLTGSR